MIELVKETVPADGSLYEKMVIMPLNFMGIFTICYLENPLMKTPFKYLICSVSVVFFLYFLELTPFDLLVLCLIGAFIGFLTLLLELAKVSENKLSIIFEIISVFAAIIWEWYEMDKKWIWGWCAMRRIWDWYDMEIWQGCDRGVRVIWCVDVGCWFEKH